LTAWMFRKVERERAAKAAALDGVSSR
jgi:cbb3-type cytochrome oxidase subunit 3